MHHHIYKHGESESNDSTVNKAYWLDISSEHHRIYLNGCDHIPMEEDIEVTIPIEITFTNGHAKITIRNWENQNVKPGGV